MKNKKGQILLITVMLLATVMTIVLSISFKSVTETQITKLEEESQKALAAAESAIEVVLKEKIPATLGSGSLSSISGFSGGATINSTASKTFTTPNIPKDGSYTFYLGNYSTLNKTIASVTDSNTLTICFQSGSQKPAIEITLVKLSGVKKYVVDDPSLTRTTGAIAASIIPPCNGYGFSTNILGSDIGNDAQFLLVRVLYAPTKLFFSRATNLPLQGTTVPSQATSSTSTGASVIVIGFQSYPQIPAEFFTTTF
jgi:hypothetical protein